MLANQRRSEKYCTTHGEMVAIVEGIGDPFHFYSSIFFDSLFEKEEEYELVCFGEFAECPPPETTEDMWSWVFENEESLNATEEII